MKGYYKDSEICPHCQVRKDIRPGWNRARLGGLMNKKEISNDVFRECGCCGMFHPIDFEGDCRDDNNRFSLDELPDDYEIYSLEAQIEDDKD